MRLNKKHDGTKQYPLFCKIDQDNWEFLANEPNKTRTINQALKSLRTDRQLDRQFDFMTH